MQVIWKGTMERKKNVTHISHLDFPEGGQISVRQGRAYVGHLKPPLGTSIIDVSDPRHPKLLSRLPVPISTFQVPMDNIPKKRRFGSHQPCEQTSTSLVPVTWFSGGLRLVDLSDPYFTKEKEFFIPEPCSDQPITQSNDVAMDERGLFYLIDRHNGFDVLEFNG